MTLTINKTLFFVVFFYSMQVTNYSPVPLVKNLLDNNFKHLSQEFTVNKIKFIEKISSVV